MEVCEIHLETSNTWGKINLIIAFQKRKRVLKKHQNELF